MYGYISGTIKEINSSYVIIDNNGIGYLVYVPNPYGYQLEKEYTIYTYTNVREDEYTLYGLLEEAIESENINYLKKFPKIGDKVAKQVILDLKGKLNVISTGIFKKEDHTDELVSALSSLGYKTVDINKVIKKIDTSKELDSQIKEALKLLLK